MTKPSTPLDGQRILQLVSAEPGWKAWFNQPEGGIKSRSVAAWAWVETQEITQLGKPYSRKHEVIPFVCNGPPGMEDATLIEGYVGLTTEGEDLSRIEKLAEELRASEAEGDDKDEDA